MPKQPPRCVSHRALNCCLYIYLAWCVCIISNACFLGKENPEKTATAKELQAAARKLAREKRAEKKAQDAAEKRSLDKQRNAKPLADSKITKVGSLEHIKLVDLF